MLNTLPAAPGEAHVDSANEGLQAMLHTLHAVPCDPLATTSSSSTPPRPVLRRRPKKAQADVPKSFSDHGKLGATIRWRKQQPDAIPVPICPPNLAASDALALVPYHDAVLASRTKPEETLQVKTFV